MNKVEKWKEIAKKGEKGKERDGKDSVRKSKK